MSQNIIYGAGGHARVIADALKKSGKELIAYFDDADAISSINRIPVMNYANTISPDAKLIIGVGNNKIRKQISAYVNHKFGIVIHPGATIAADAIIGEGSVVLAGAVIQSGVTIGKHVIVNANVTIDHDAIVSDFSSIYPNSYIGAKAYIGAGATIEAGAVIKRFAKINGIFPIKELTELDLS